MELALWNLIFIPLWVIFFIFILILLIFAFWLWAVIDCFMTKELGSIEKLVWILILLFFNFFGAIGYVIFSRKTKMDFKGKKLYRSRKNRMIAGVCGGMGEFFGVDATIIRLIWVLITLFTFGFAGVIAYIVAWIIIPEK